MLQKLKSEYREVKKGAPGHRFLDHYERSRRREGDRVRVLRTWGYVGVGLVLLICGFLLSLPPAVPGFLLWIPGLSLIASRSKRISKLLDRLEVWARKMCKAVRTLWRRYRFPVLLPVAALVFAAVHLAFEHFTGGVQSHNLLNRPDMPTVSNWLGLVALPFLGVVLGLRVCTHASPPRVLGMPIPVLTAFAGALVYGGVMAASFELGASGVTSVAFLGLFVVALALPVYRAEYVAGFVTGMTFTFGGVLPLLVAGVVAIFSFVVRYAFRSITGWMRRRSERGRRENGEIRTP